MERLCIFQMLLTMYPRLESSVLDFVYVVNMTKMIKCQFQNIRGKNQRPSYLSMFHKTIEKMKHLYVL